MNEYIILFIIYITFWSFFYLSLFVCVHFSNFIYHSKTFEVKKKRFKIILWKKNIIKNIIFSYNRKNFENQFIIIKSEIRFYHLINYNVDFYHEYNLSTFTILQKLYMFEYIWNFNDYNLIYKLFLYNKKVCYFYFQN